MRDDERREPSRTGSERELLTGFLDFQRDTLRWKIDGLSRGQLLRTLPPSSMTLLGMVRHLAWVEEHWFSSVFLGRRWSATWRDVDWSKDPDAEWHSAADVPTEETLTLWEDAVALSERAAADHELDELARGGSAEDAVSLRWILIHLIEEYARHNGHADLIRESIDGLVGQ